MANPVGRPRKEIDFAEVDSLCSMHCTGEEIAGHLKINYETLSNHCKEQVKEDGTHYRNFSDYFKVNCANGKITLRRMQWNSANKGNVNMQIWLGKNYLNQTEKQEIDVKSDNKIKVTLDDVMND